MAVDGGDKKEKKEVEEQQVTVEAPELIGEPRVDDLEQVDPFGHEGIFALLDEGCNSSCQTRSWRINAELKLKRGPRLAMKDTPRTAGTYRGIGGAETTCRKIVPICLKMEPCGLTVSGSIATNEIDGRDFPLLLSLQVRQKLGLKKDTRKGIVELTDYPGQFLRLYQHHRTGLLMIRLDHFSDKLSAGRQEFSFEDYPMLPEAGEDTPSRTVKALRSLSPALRAYTVDYTTKGGKITCMSAGLFTLDEGEESCRASLALKTSVSDMGIQNWASANPANLGLIRSSLRANYPHVCNDVTDENNLLCIDCRTLPHPGKKSGLHDHLGTHPQNLKFMFESQEFEHLLGRIARAMHKMLRNVPAGANLVVLTFCKGGKHRAYAMMWILKRILKEIYDQECGVIDCSRTVNWRNTLRYVHRVCWHNGRRRLLENLGKGTCLRSLARSLGEPTRLRRDQERQRSRQELKPCSRCDLAFLRPPALPVVLATVW